MTKVSIHQDLLLHILYGSPDGRRYTQDTPVLPEVWIQCARDIGQPVKGLIVPRYNHQAHHVAEELHERIQRYRNNRNSQIYQTRSGANVADMPGLITLECHFDEVVNVVLPLTRWWSTEGMKDLVELREKDIAEFAKQAFEHLKYIEVSRKTGSAYDGQASNGSLGRFFETSNESSGADAKQTKRTRLFPDGTARVLLLLSLIHAANSSRLNGIGEKIKFQDETLEVITIEHLGKIDAEAIGNALCDILQVTFLRERSDPETGHYRRLRDEHNQRVRTEQASEELLRSEADGKESTFDPRLIFSFSINREGIGAVADSVKTTKADAASRLFALSSSGITWAVIDSGIDAQHHAFRRYPQNFEFGPQVDWETIESDVSGDDTRVTARYDMTLVSELRNRDSLFDAASRNQLAQRIQNNILRPSLKNEVLSLLEQASEDLKQHRPLNWDLVEQIARVRHDCTPTKSHGTHVAGTLGGHWPEVKGGKTVWVEGMCPDINLMDFNVIGASLKATEFAVIAAMRLIRHLNERSDYMVIHGANLSLAIPHDVTNYACGRTPVCVECEALVNNGVVVVAAAGNAGYNIFKTSDRDMPLHTETSIADPGNAEAVITVGSTHRLEPHNYGVSYFSSRGPTGDGRLKPDLVAPGEKIDAPICNQQFATLEGTSMAAPHVSGAAALLMARFPELVGNPSRIKHILCDSATDLGRERAYQGRGLVDVLRAMQSV